MKRYLSTWRLCLLGFLSVFSNAILAQTTIYSENMGLGTKVTQSIADNVFQNGAPISYSGTAETKYNLFSDYPGASGGKNVLFNANNEYFLIEGINTIAYTSSSLILSFGQHKSTNANNNQLAVEVSADGSTWTPLTYTRPTGGGTSNWRLITASGTIPATNNLRIRFTAKNANQWRVDDVKLVGTIASNTLTTSPITGSPFCMSSTVGSPVNVGYTATGVINAGNIFTAQLSNANGSFTNATNIGTLSSTNLTGTINATIPAGTPAGTAYRIRVISSNPAMTGTDNAANLTINIGNTITQQPTNQSVGIGATATFNVVATGATSYQWQISTNCGATWSDITGATTDSYTVSSALATMNGDEYRVKVVSSCGNTISDIALLNVSTTSVCLDETVNASWGSGSTTTTWSAPVNGNTWTGNKTIINSTANPAYLGFNPNPTNTTNPATTTPYVQLPALNKPQSITVSITKNGIDGTSGPDVIWLQYLDGTTWKDVISYEIKRSITQIVWENKTFDVTAYNQYSSFRFVRKAAGLRSIWIKSFKVMCGDLPTTATTYTWTGNGGNTSWDTACNWSPKGVPTAIDNVIVNTTPTNILNITDGRVVNDFTLNATGNFNMSATGNLTIKGNVTYAGNATATLDCNSQIIIKSATQQTVPPLAYGNLDVTGGDRIFLPGKTTSICQVLKVNPAANYTTTNSVIEYNGSADQDIVVIDNYFDLKISGSGIKKVLGTVNVDHIVSVVSAELRLPATADNVASNVLTAGEGLQNTGGIVTLENNAILLQNDTANNIGNIKVKRNATVPETQYNLWSSPVENQDLYALYGTPNSVAANKVMEYMTINDSFKPVVAGTTSIAAKGYSAAGLASNNVVAQFVGVPNNGDISIPLSIVGKRFNLVGNPYPSNLDLGTLYDENPGSGNHEIAPTVFFWDNTGNTDLWQQGGNYSGNNYATYNLDATMGNPATSVPGSTKVPDGVIKPGQAFLVKANSSGTKSLKFTNNQRIPFSSPSTPYFKGGASKNRYWLALETPDGIVNMLAINYDEKSSNLYDSYDSQLANTSASDLFYSMSDDQYKLGIQTRKGAFVDNDTFKLGMKNYKAGQHKISLYKAEGLFETSQAIYLHDKLTDTYTDLNETSYTFAANAETLETRFEIVYRSGTVLGNQEVSSKESIVVYTFDNHFVVRSNDLSITKIELYDMEGRLMQLNNKIAKEVKIDASLLNAGVYILKIYQDNYITTKKVLK